MIETLADGVHAIHAPTFRFLGLFRVGARMTVLRLRDGGLVLHSPVPLDAAAKEAVSALGTVRYIVAPNLFHHLFAGDAVATWPDATLVAPEGLRKKRRDLPIARTLDAPPPAWSGEIDALPIAGSMLGEHVLFHRATGTLVTADVVENFKEMDDFATRLYLKSGGLYQKPGWHRLARVVYRDRKAARTSFEAILDLPIARVIVAHGDPILAEPKDVLREGLRFLLEA